MKHSERNLYEYEGSIVELSPTFVYEVVINKYWKNGFCQLDSKLYKAERLLHIKKDCTITKFPEYRIEKEISLIGVPQEFIVEQNLSKYIKKSKKKMNNEIVFKDKFVDYAGKEHQFVIAAVKSKLNDVMEDDVQYAIGIGVSICNPSDTFDEKIGTLKALGRAYKSVPVAYSYHSGQLSDDVMNAFIQQEIKYIKQHPEKYIHGYKDAYIKFQNEKNLKVMEKDFSDIEKVIVEGIKKDPEYLNNVTQYIALWKKYGKKD